MIRVCVFRPTIYGRSVIGQDNFAIVVHVSRVVASLFYCFINYNTPPHFSKWFPTVITCTSSKDVGRRRTNNRFRGYMKETTLLFSLPFEIEAFLKEMMKFGQSSIFINCVRGAPLEIVSVKSIMYMRQKHCR